MNYVTCPRCKHNTGVSGEIVFCNKCGQKMRVRNPQVVQIKPQLPTPPPSSINIDTEPRHYKKEEGFLSKFFRYLVVHFRINCSICHTVFKRNKYFWDIQGECLMLCPNCNRKMEGRKSTAAFNDFFKAPTTTDESQFSCDSGKTQEIDIDDFQMDYDSGRSDSTKFVLVMVVLLMAGYIFYSKGVIKPRNPYLQEEVKEDPPYEKPTPKKPTSKNTRIATVEEIEDMPLTSSGKEIGYWYYKRNPHLLKVPHQRKPHISDAKWEEYLINMAIINGDSAMQIMKIAENDSNFRYLRSAKTLAKKRALRNVVDFFFRHPDYTDEEWMLALELYIESIKQNPNAF